MEGSLMQFLIVPEEMEPKKYYKLVGNPYGTGLFYISYTKAYSCGMSFSYERSSFEKMFKQCKFYEISFKDVMEDITKGKIISLKTKNGERLREMFPEPYDKAIC